MADSADRSELILSVQDLISPGILKAQRALADYNVATGNADKTTVKFEATLAKAASSLGIYGASATKSGASVTKAGQASVKAAQGASQEWRIAASQANAYAAELSRINSLSLKADATGQVRTAGGQFGPSVASQTRSVEGYIAATQRASAALEREAEVYAQLSASTGISNTELKENLSLQQAQAALQLRRTAALVPGNPVLSSASATKPSTSIGPVAAGSGALAAQTKAAGAAAEGAAASTSKYGTALQKLEGLSNSTRYALFSVAQQLTKTGLALVALPVATAIVAASFDRDFANVSRATATATGGSTVNLTKLRGALVDLSEQIPVSFKDITDIATQGAQLGVTGTKGLESFTKTVAELSATTNLSADAAGTLLGRFLAVGAINTKDFDKLASSVLNVGVNSAATESQISAIATQIVGIGKIAGFTSPQIVGLSGAIASVSSNGAALARGAITRFITVLQSAVESGGPALDAFAKTAHLSATQIQEDWGTSKFAGDFQKFFKGLSQQGGEANQTLIAMGITSVRDIPLFLNLANGWKTLNRAMKDADSGWENTTILQIHYAKINDTLVSKVKELGNTFLATLDSMGKLTSGPLVDLVTGITGAIKAIGAFLATPFGQRLGTITLELGLVVGAFLLLTGAVARGVAGFQAMTTVMRSLSTSFRTQAVAATGSAIATDGATASFALSGRAAKIASVGVGLLADALKAASLVGLIFLGLQLAEPIVSAGADFERSALGITNSQKQITKAAKDGVAALDNLSSFSAPSNTTGILGNLIYGNAGKGLAGFENDLKELNDSWLKLDFTGTGDRAKKLDAAFASLVNSGNTKKATTEFKEISDEWKKDGGSFSSLLAYFPKYAAAIKANTKASDTFSNAVDKQQKALIELNTTFQTVSGMNAKQFGKYQDAVTKSIAPLTDFNTAVSDVQNSLQAQAQAQADAAGGQAKATDYYNGTSVSIGQLTQQMNSNASTANQWLANIRTVASTLGTDVANQFIQAGYSVTNESILQQLINATPAQQAAYVQATVNAQNAAAGAAGTALILAGGLITDKGGQIGADTAKKIGAQLLAGFSPADIMKEFNLQFSNNPGVPKTNTKPAQATFDQFIRTNNDFKLNGQVDMSTVGGQTAIDHFVQMNSGKQIPIYVNYYGQYQGVQINGAPMVPQGFTGGYFNGSGFNYASGGFTGPGGKYDPAGIVHRGEFVFNKEATSAYGPAFLLNMMRSFRGAQRAPGYASGGVVGGGSTVPSVMTVQLSAYDRALLQHQGNISLYLDGKELTNSNDNNSVTASNRRKG